jgi:hypothetical protein
MDEFQRAFEPPIQAAFKIADADKDGTLAKNEIGAAIGHLAVRLGMPEPKK